MGRKSGPSTSISCRSTQCVEILGIILLPSDVMGLRLADRVEAQNHQTDRKKYW